MMEIEGVMGVVADSLWIAGAVLGRASSRDGRPVRRGEEADGKGFRLKLHEKKPDDPLSPVYFNLRTTNNPKPGPLLDEHVNLIGQLHYEMAIGAKVPFMAAAGLPHAGTPLAAAFVRCANSRGKKPIDLLTLAKEEGGEGRRIGGIISGSCVLDGEVVVIDDLITGADSKLEAIDVLREAGYLVEHVFVLVDREQGGRQELEKAGVKLHAAFTACDLIRRYRRRGWMSEEDYTAAMAYLGGWV